MEENKIGSNTVFTGSVEMSIPAGHGNIRVAEFRLPHLFKTKPTINLTVYAQDRDTIGDMFVVYIVKINELGSETQISIEANNVRKASPNSAAYFCDYIVIGEIIC